MSYFVTGATGFIGRFLTQELLDNREGEIFVLVRDGSQKKMEKLIGSWGHSGRITPVIGDISAPALGVDPAWVAAHRGKIAHFFHLAAIYDITAGDEVNDRLNIGGTRNALDLAGDLDVGTFHQVSSIAASGDYAGTWDETQFDVGQGFPSPYHRTKFASEKIVREECPVPWRVYRPAVVIGSSQTGEMDKIDGPYYFFPALKAMRDLIPGWVPFVGIDLGDTNLVPIDYVAKAMDHLAHVPDRDGEAFHLVNPEPQRTIDMINAFAEAAKAPRFAVPVDRSLLPTGLLPRNLQPSNLFARVASTSAGHAALKQTIGRLGLPPEAVEHAGMPTVYASRHTEQALAGSGISVPSLESYALRDLELLGGAARHLHR